jgi:hypothetical protein
MKYELKELPPYLIKAIEDYADHIAITWNAVCPDNSSVEHELVDACLRFHNESPTDNMPEAPNTQKEKQ